MADLSGSTQFRSIKATLPSGLMGGVYFETPGGTPSLLNSYQAETLSIPFGGAWAAPQNVNVIAEKIGNTVTLTFAPVSASANTAVPITSTVSLPSVFCPTANTVSQPAVLISNSTVIIGALSVFAGGIIYISPIGGNFSTTGYAEWPKSSILYTTAAL